MDESGVETVATSRPVHSSEPYHVDSATLAEPARSAPPPSGRRILAALSFRRLSAIYIFVVLFAIFSFWIPQTFLTASTWRSVLDGQSLTAMAAIALLIPVAAGAFDLAIGAQIGFTSIFVSWLLVDKGMSVAVAVPLTIVVGAAIGGFSALLVAAFRIDSFIATLGVSSVILASTNWLSGGAQILNLPQGFSSFSTLRLFGITVPVYLMLLVALVVWYVLENTPLGRQIYATGGNEASSRLAGVRTRWVVAGSFLACGVIASMVGLLLASRLGTGDPTSGPSFLLPAFSAVFLGATQFRSGRFNVWGTVVAVYVLAVGVKGLQLAGAATWIPDMFNGLALILAVGLANVESGRRRFASLSRLVLRRQKNGNSIDPASTGPAAKEG
jgi:ribose transport system permease protein